MHNWKAGELAIIYKKKSRVRFENIYYREKFLEKMIDKIIIIIMAILEQEKWTTVHYAFL